MVVATHPEVGIAIDNNCALQVVVVPYRLVTSQPVAYEYRVSKRLSEINVQRLEENEEYAPIAKLLQ